MFSFVRILYTKSTHASDVHFAYILFFFCVHLVYILCTFRLLSVQPTHFLSGKSIADLFPSSPKGRRHAAEPVNKSGYIRFLGPVSMNFESNFAAECLEWALGTPLRGPKSRGTLAAEKLYRETGP